MEEKDQVAAEDKTQNAEEMSEDQNGQETEEKVQEEQVELSAEEKLQKEVAEYKDKFTRLYAEFDNFRKRNARERIDLIKNANADLLSNLLPILDDFDRAVVANENNEDIEAVKEGFVLIQSKVSNLLQSKGLKPMDAMGKTFDVEFHEAITNIPAPSEDMKGKVVDVVEKGYYLNEAVLRYAKVVVGQ